jgi:signal transduction histidine kinase
MKKTQDEAVLNDAYHTLKSPIVSMKSMLFVLGKNKNIEGNKVIQDKIFQIEEKLNVLHKRAEIFLNYIVFKEGKVEFLYSFFNLNDVLEKAIDAVQKEYGKRFSFKKSADQPIMADEEHIAAALKIIFTTVHLKAIPGIIPITVIFSGKSADIIVRYQFPKDVEKLPRDRDEENVLKQEQYVAHRIIELHGGRVNYEQNGADVEVTISIPLKARASRRK